MRLNQINIEPGNRYKAHIAGVAHREDASFQSEDRAAFKGSPRQSSAKRARTLSDAEFDHLLGVALSTSAIPLLDELALLLSYFAALRVAEIATLTSDDVTDASGNLTSTITIQSANAKNGRGRDVPMHPRIRTLLQRIRSRYPGLVHLAPRRTDLRRPTTPNALATWFARLYQRAGLRGCSSHSGRRTCITNLAKRANQFRNSLRDVQLIAGHARLETTSAYISASEDLAPLIASLGSDSGLKTR